MKYKKQKTDYAIQNALISLLGEKDYQDISISEIIDASQSSRSTFYAHYKKKDEILISYVDSMMNHVFDPHHHFNHKEQLVHIFSHIKEDAADIRLILDSSASHIFRNELKKRLSLIVDAFYASNLFGNKNIPSDLARHQYLDDLISLIQYYVHEGENISPEDISRYYFEIFK